MDSQENETSDAQTVRWEGGGWELKKGGQWIRRCFRAAHTQERAIHFMGMIASWFTGQLYVLQG